jgi:hypothetical protein
MRFHIDDPTDPSEFAPPAVYIDGWCFDEDGRKIAGVRARIRSRTVSGTYPRHRPDVMLALDGPPSSEWSGFRIAARLPPGTCRVRLEADIDGIGWTGFHEQVFTVPWLAALGHLQRHARLWIEALFGWPAALDRLSRCERELLYSRIERKARHPPHLRPHHAPRPLVPERFPAHSQDPERLPKITVVTPSYRHAKFLEATLLSVLGQEGVRVDYIVQDGGSTDGSAEILGRYGARLKHWVSEPDGGQADAVRKGFAQADCGPDDVMTYLNSDDLFMPGALRFVAGYFARNPEVDVVYGHRVLIDEAGLEVGRWFTPRPSCLELRIYDLVPQETLFWRKRIWDKVGGVDPRFQFALDWDLLLRFADAGARFHRLPWFLGVFRLHPGQKSGLQMDSVGIPEMDRLRVRSFGRMPGKDEMDLARLRTKLDSFIVAALWRRGLRI